MAKRQTKELVRDKLLPAQRQNFILDVLYEQRAATLFQLSERIGASFSTVRRDLDEMAEKGLLKRTHGGAMLMNSRVGHAEPDDLSKEKAQSTNKIISTEDHIQKAKKMIARIAITRLRDGDSVIFDSSTTVLEVARLVVASKLRIVAITNNIKIAEILADAPNVRLIMPGGTKRPGTYMFTGDPGDIFFRQLHADIAFIGAQNASSGILTDSRVESASHKRLLMGSARVSILLIDSYKFGGPGFCEVADLKKFSEVITDAGLAKSEYAGLKKRGINLSLAPAR
jgi:DeoR family transcriptional regulator of aga operon